MAVETVYEIPREPHRPRLAAMFRRDRGRTVPPPASDAEDEGSEAAADRAVAVAPSAAVLQVVVLSAPEPGAMNIVFSHVGTGRVDEILVRLADSSSPDGTTLALRTPSSSLMPGEAFVAHVPAGRPESFVSVSWVHAGVPGRLLVPLR